MKKAAAAILFFSLLPGLFSASTDGGHSEREEAHRIRHGEKHGKLKHNNVLPCRRGNNRNLRLEGQEQLSGPLHIRNPLTETRCTFLFASFDILLRSLYN